MRRKQRGQQATSSITFPVLLVDQANDRGAVADLTLTLQQGSGQVAPSPEPAKLSRERSFLSAEENAQKAVSLPKDWDVLWRLVRRDGEPISRLTGGSLGAAFAIGSAKLLAINGSAVPRLDRTTLVGLNLSQVSISAQIKSDGALTGGRRDSLQAAGRLFGILPSHSYCGGDPRSNDRVK